MDKSIHSLHRFPIDPICRIKVLYFSRHLGTIICGIEMSNL